MPERINTPDVKCIGKAIDSFNCSFYQVRELSWIYQGMLTIEDVGDDILHGHSNIRKELAVRESALISTKTSYIHELSSISWTLILATGAWVP